jgi:hypothetical protein
MVGDSDCDTGADRIELFLDFLQHSKLPRTFLVLDLLVDGEYCFLQPVQLV